jgi:hypothetical protein
VASRVSTRPRSRLRLAGHSRTGSPRTPSSRRGHPGTSYSGQPILAIREHTSERRASQFVHDALGELHAFIRDHDIHPAGPPFTIVNHTPKPGTLDIEAVWPIDGPAAGAGRIHGGTLPVTLAGGPDQPARGARSDDNPTEVLF